MHGAVAPGWLLVALCAAAGVACLLRTRSPVEEQRRTAGDEALMGFGMAAMAVPTAVLAPPRWAWLAYAAVFGAAALRALWAARTSPPHLHHAVGALAMVYTAAVMAVAPGAHGGHGPSGVPLVTGALLLYFTAYVLWAGVRLIPVAAVAGGGRSAGAMGWSDRPEVARACRLSMGIAMLAMLLAL
ncbi:DUF5134 domain-containing protein [Streptomyces bluensis]|uniref:DUF5134 domain-containing protein n=1 Tax=Streptomyces bluensis TaxID=33897 RepID=UPI001062C511|nr:DUF5134 domain-containing protein [Streptomyces bluensis]GGZ44166.1 DUF5134 domain-containing protein [Streptomyces bluensis]